MKEGETRGWHSKGSNHYNWKEKPNYRTLHRWVFRNKPKTESCENCGNVMIKLECANISGKYLRDISDYRWLCRRCHMESDNRIGNLKQGDVAIFHLLQFENTNPDDGKMYWDAKRISKEELLQKLHFIW